MLLDLAFLVFVSICTSSSSVKKGFEVKSIDGKEFVNELQLWNHRIAQRTLSDDFKIITISPTVIRNDDIVSVTYQSVTPSEGDFIAAFSPPYHDLKSTVPVKYAWCDESVDYLSTGKGVLYFNLTNLREDVGFYYFTGTTKAPVLVAESSSNVSFADNNEPLRARIVPTTTVGGGDLNSSQPSNSSFKLLWSSATSTEPAMKWGETSVKYDYKVTATSTRIDRSDMCGGVANSTGWRDLGLIHTAVWADLSGYSGRKIYYVFGDAATKSYSNERVFFVPPAAGAQPPSRPTRAIVYCDMGRGSNDSSFTWNEYGRPSYLTALRVGGEVAAGEVDVFLHGGDISYAQGFAAVWDFFLDMISPFAGSVPYLTTVGNHESDWPGTASLFKTDDSGGECGVSATTLIPPPSPASKDQPWWSYDVGLMHFVGMSTEHDFAAGSEQYIWLEKDLKTIDRSKTPWVIFNGHRAMYINSDFGGFVFSDISVSDLMIEHIEPLLFRYRVNLAFYGHDHVYQRQSAVYKRRVIQPSSPRLDDGGNTVYWYDDPQATVHMVVGTAGAMFHVNDVHPPPAWNEVNFYRYGYAHVTAENATQLTWDWVESATGIVYDRAVITQDIDWGKLWFDEDFSISTGGDIYPDDRGTLAMLNLAMWASIGLVVLSVLMLCMEGSVRNAFFACVGYAAVEVKTSSDDAAAQKVADVNGSNYTPA